jgi:hypothetical protein
MRIWPCLVVLGILFGLLPVVMRVMRRIPSSNDDFGHI